MKRILLIAVGLWIVILAGGYMYLKSNLEMVTGAIGKTVESATGKPLILDAPPGLSFFPKIGLDVGKARWGDAVKDDLSLTCERAVVRVDLMALLNGRIEVNEVTLDSPRLVYHQAKAQTQKAGQEKAPATPSALADNKAAAGDPKAGTLDDLRLDDLRLDAVRINSADVRIEQPGLNLQMSRIDLTLADFAVGKSGTLNVAMHVALRATGNEPVEADVAVKTDFVPQHPVVKVRNCALKLVPLKGLPITKPVSVGGKADIDVVLQSLAQMELAVDFAGSAVQVKGQVSLAGPAGQFDIVGRGIPREILAACGVALPAMAPKALSALDVSSRVKLNGAKVELADLKGKLDDTTFSGNLSASAAAFSGALKLDSLNVDQYLPAQAASGAGGESKPVSAAASGGKSSAPAKPQASGKPAYPEVRLELAVESLKVNNLAIAGLKAMIQGKAGQYALDPCTFRFYESAVTLAARAQLTDHQYNLKTTANNINVGVLLNDAAKVDKVEGRINVQTDLSMRGTDETAIRRSLDGTVKLTGQLNVDTGLLPSDWGQVIRNIKTLHVNKIEAMAKADKGHIVVKPISADGEIKVNGQGTVDLPSDSLDIRLDAALAGMTVPLLVRGTLKSPSYGVDPVGVLKNVLEKPKAIEEGLKGLLKKKF